MSEYKRLTRRNEDGTTWVKCSVCDNQYKCDITQESCCEVLQDRLAELEDKIESRKLVELKYKKGDYVFFISWLSGNVCEGTVVDWEEDRGYCIICGNDMISAYECFSTEEAAEARLKGLQEEQK